MDCGELVKGLIERQRKNEYMSLDLGQLGGFQDGSKILDVWVVLAELQVNLSCEKTAIV